MSVLPLFKTEEQCATCNQIKPVICFTWVKNRNRYAEDCKECRNKKTKERYWQNIEKSREYQRNKAKKYKNRQSEYHLKTTYGLTTKDKKELLLKQNQKCAVCSAFFSKAADAKIDHDHSTGRVRELLCHNCNVSLGLLKEDLKIVDALKAYLEKHKGLNLQSFSKFAEYIKERENAYVIETNKGFASYSILGEVCYIRDLYVLPEFRRSKVASDFAKAVAEAGKAAGCKTLVCGVAPQANGTTGSLSVILANGFELKSATETMIWFVRGL